MVGAVSLSKSIQPFLFPAQVGAGRIAKFGRPLPEFLGPFVGGLELVSVSGKEEEISPTSSNSQNVDS